MYSHYYTPDSERDMLPQRRALAKPLNGEEGAELAQIAAESFALPTEQDKEASEREHEHDMDGSGQQVMPRHQHTDEPEDDACGQEHAHKLGARDEGRRVVLPAPPASKEKC